MSFHLQGAGNFTIAKNGCATDDLIVVDILSKRFDNDLLLSDQIIYNKTCEAVAFLNDNNRKILRFFLFFFHIQYLIKTDQWDNGTTEMDHLLSLNIFDLIYRDTFNI